MENVYPKENVIQAIYNLRGYCCQEGYLKQDKWICTKNIDIEKGTWPQSRYLYDHIIDVWFRNLDWFKDKLHANMAEPEEKAVKRRDKINELAVDAEGSMPLQIVKSFEDARYDPAGWSDQSSVRIISVDRTQDISDWIENFAGKVKRSEMWLASKYYATCYIWLFLNPEIKKNGSKKSSYLQCRALANNRISKESGLVKVISIEQWAAMLANNLSIYTSDYFVQQGLMRLLDKVGRFGSDVNYLQQKAQGTHECSGG